MRVLAIVAILLSAARVTADIIVRPEPAKNAKDIELRISLEPSSGLPGIVPTLHVTARNRGRAQAEVHTAVKLFVEPVGREPFYAYSELRGDRGIVMLPGMSGTSVVALEPGESRTFTWWGFPEGPDWFEADRRLWNAGSSYTVQIQTAWEPRIESNKAAYKVLTPSGSDAAVWALIKAEGSPLWHGLADTIWAEYPDSLYARYTVPMGKDRNELIQNLETAIAKAPHALVRQSHQFDVADHLKSLCYELRKGGDLEGAIASCERARSIYKDLAKNAIDSQIRADAEIASSGDYLSRSYVMEEWNSDHGIYPDEVLPEYVCFDRTSDGKKRIWFGYSNRTRTIKQIPIGPQNMFTPPPHDRGQPTQFRGYSELAFSVIPDQPVLTWHLYKDKVTVKVNEVLPCPADYLERIAEITSQ